MKLKKFDSLTATTIRKGKATISFNPTGTVGLSGTACAAIGISPGDTVCLFKDEESEGDWYLAKDCEDGFKLRANVQGGKGCSFNAVAITGSVLNDLSWQEKGAAICRVVTEPISVKGGG